MLHRVIGSAVAGLMLTGSAHAAFVTVGTYDENTTQTNAVDRSATFASGTGGTSAANVTNVTTFTTAVATAFTANLGGVINFDSETYETGNQSIVGNYGLAQTKTLTINDGNAGGLGAGGTSTVRTPISGSATMGKVNTPESAVRNYLLNIGTITGGLPGEGVIQFAFTLIDKTEGSNITASATATFSGGGTVTASSTNYLGTGTGEDNNDDIFFGFVAPTGQTITSIAIPDFGTFVTLDDVAFITIPEPSSLALAGLGALCLLPRRRQG